MSFLDLKKSKRARSSDLDKRNLVIVVCFQARANFCPAASKSTACFKSGQK